MKRILGIVMCVVILAGLTGCKKEEEKNVDVKELGEALLTQITYQDELEEIEKDTASSIYDFSDITIVDSSVYVSSGATAEEIAVVKCENKEDAKKIEAVFQSRVEEQRESFENYIPEELEKISKALIVTKGCYVVLSISNDEKAAKDIIHKVF